MKNTLILHGKDGDSQENWFPWLEKELEKEDYKVWVPDLPGADKPSIERHATFLLENNAESILIGHSSGAVTILGLLQSLPEDTKVDTCYLVGSFKDDLGWDSLKDLFVTPFDYEKIKTKAKNFIFIHSDDDPYCPLEHAQYLSEKLNGELIVIKGQKHFSVGTYGEDYKKFPYLRDLILGVE